MAGTTKSSRKTSSLVDPAEFRDWEPLRFLYRSIESVLVGSEGDLEDFEYAPFDPFPYLGMEPELGGGVIVLYPPECQVVSDLKVAGAKLLAGEAVTIDACSFLVASPSSFWTTEQLAQLFDGWVQAAYNAGSPPGRVANQVMELRLYSQRYEGCFFARVYLLPEFLWSAPNFGFHARALLPDEASLFLSSWYTKFDPDLPCTGWLLGSLTAQWLSLPRHFGAREYDSNDPCAVPLCENASAVPVGWSGATCVERKAIVVRQALEGVFTEAKAFVDVQFHPC